MTSTYIAFAAGVAALATMSCSGGTSAASCTAGRTVECACTSGARGAQTCTAAGIYSPCSCGGSSKTPTTTETRTADADPLSCEAVVDHFVELQKAEADKNGDEDLGPEVADSIRNAVLEMCTDLDWPVAARQCVLGAATPHAIDGCMRGVKGMEFIERSKTTEAREFVNKLYQGARAYYMDGSRGRGIQPMPPQFPTVSVGPTPPLGECCRQGGKCAPGASQWEHETWTALMFSVDDPHYYSYSYITKDPYTEFTVRANGDLDCDGEYSTFEMLGIIDAENPDGPSGDAPMGTVAELE